MGAARLSWFEHEERMDEGEEWKMVMQDEEEVIEWAGKRAYGESKGTQGCSDEQLAVQ